MNRTEAERALRMAEQAGVDLDGPEPEPGHERRRWREGQRARDRLAPPAERNVRLLPMAGATAAPPARRTAPPAAQATAAGPSTATAPAYADQQGHTGNTLPERRMLHDPPDNDPDQYEPGQSSLPVPLITGTANTAKTAESEGRMAVRPLSSLRTSTLLWLCVGYLPRGAVTVLAGDEGIGKSLWWVLLVAHLTTGRPLDAVGYAGGTPQDVLLICTEDPSGEVIARLELAGADMARLHWLSENEDGTGPPTVPGRDLDVLTTALEDLADAGTPVGLVVVDAWLDTVHSALRVADPQQARQALRPWHVLAGQYELAVLLVVNTNRLDSSSPRDRYGSTGVLRQKARMALYAARSPQGTVLIGPDKANGTALREAGAYEVEAIQVREATANDPGTVGRIRYRSTSGAPIGDHLAAWRTEAKHGDHPTADDKAEAWLRDHLRTRGGSAPADDVKAAAKVAGHNPERLARLLRDRLAGRAAPDGSGGPWLYALPTEPTPEG